jgi:hypothetical protein
MEWCVFDDRDDVAHRIVYCYFQDAEKRVEDMSGWSGYISSQSDKSFLSHRFPAVRYAQ